MKTIITTICVLGIILLVIISVQNPPVDQNYNNCIDVVNQAIPDPNNTDERAELLSNCLE